MKSYVPRVTWKIIRRDGEWFSVVLIGESPVTHGPFANRGEARDNARIRASRLNRAGR
jgi:hypothetical protein